MALKDLAAPRRLILDTSACSSFRRGHEEACDLVARAEEVLFPVTVLGELAAAFALSRRRAENESWLRRFLAEPYVGVLSADAAVAHDYGEVFAALRRAGTPIPTNDIWIAAHARVARGHLLTFDGDFARVPGLTSTILPVP